MGQSVVTSPTGAAMIISDAGPAVLLQRAELKLARLEQRRATDAHKSNAASQEKMVAIQTFTALWQEAVTRASLHRSELDRLEEERRRVQSYFREIKVAPYGHMGPPRYNEGLTIEDFAKKFPDGDEVLTEMANRVPLIEVGLGGTGNLEDSYLKAVTIQGKHIRSRVDSAYGDCEKYKDKLEDILSDGRLARP